MIFLTPVANFVALALVGTSLANPVELERRGDKILLGYRTVSKNEAPKINKAKTVVYEAKFAVGEKQNGIGVYITKGLGDYPWTANDDEWCSIKADKDEVKKAKKAWIKQEVKWRGLKPEDTEKNVAKAIKDIEDDWDPKKVLRLSIVAERDFLQMVIPTGLVGWDVPLLGHTKGPLDIEAECKPMKDWGKKEDHPQAEWKKYVFDDNTKGDPQ